MADMAFLVDTTKCTGCKACQVACKQWNNLPAEETGSFYDKEYTYPVRLSHITYNHVLFSGILKNEGRISWQMMHKKCYHCEIPNCKAVCPADAIKKNDSWVVIDQNRCIGCRECEKACIYGVPHVSENSYNKYGSDEIITRGKAYKCHACTITQRDVPACADACPGGALTYNYRITVVEHAKKRLKLVSNEYPNASIYGIEQFGGLHVITILKDRPQKFGLEKKPVPVKTGSYDKTKKLYNILSFFAPGFPSIKKYVYKFSKNILKNT